MDAKLLPLNKWFFGGQFNGNLLMIGCPFGGVEQNLISFQYLLKNFGVLGVFACFIRVVLMGQFPETPLDFIHSGIHC
jgi:hypothetical protein